MTERARVKQSLAFMEARGEEMWCIACGLRIDYKQKSTATKHVKYSSEHKRQQMEQMKKGITKPGTSADSYTAAAIERSFSPAGLVDVKNR